MGARQPPHRLRKAPTRGVVAGVPGALPGAATGATRRYAAVLLPVQAGTPLGSALGAARTIAGFRFPKPGATTGLDADLADWAPAVVLARLGLSAGDAIRADVRTGDRFRAEPAASNKAIGWRRPRAAAETSTVLAKRPGGAPAAGGFRDAALAAALPGAPARSSFARSGGIEAGHSGARAKRDAGDRAQHGAATGELAQDFTEGSEAFGVRGSLLRVSGA